MRCMLRNKTAFYYATYIGQTEIQDEYGNATGQYSVEYGKPVKMFGNISAAQGEIESRQFGESETYDKVIVLDDTHTSIDEYAILWVDTTPKVVGGKTTTPHDYIVKRVAKSLNSVSIAISKVSVR